MAFNDAAERAALAENSLNVYAGVLEPTACAKRSITYFFLNAGGLIDLIEFTIGYSPISKRAHWVFRDFDTKRVREAFPSGGPRRSISHDTLRRLGFETGSESWDPAKALDLTTRLSKLESSSSVGPIKRQAGVIVKPPEDPVDTALNKPRIRKKYYYYVKKGRAPSTPEHMEEVKQRKRERYLIGQSNKAALRFVPREFDPAKEIVLISSEAAQLLGSVKFCQFLDHQLRSTNGVRSVLQLHQDCITVEMQGSLLTAYNRVQNGHRMLAFLRSDSDLFVKIAEKYRQGPPRMHRFPFLEGLSLTGHERGELRELLVQVFSRNMDGSHEIKFSLPWHEETLEFEARARFGEFQWRVSKCPHLLPEVVRALVDAADIVHRHRRDHPRGLPSILRVYGRIAAGGASLSQ